MNITNGGLAINTYGYIGYEEGATGIVVVDGASWINSTSFNDEYLGETTYSGALFVGYSGNGGLAIRNGGNVDVKKETWVAYNAGSSGAISFNDGTLNTGALFAGANQLVGTGTINTNGMIADNVDLVFDSSHGLQQSIVLSDQNQKNILINLDQQANGNLGAGYAGNGTVTIQDGLVVESNVGYLGYHSSANGTMNIIGAGSTWNSSNLLHVGESGSGTLNILDGGTVNTNTPIEIGWNSGSTGTINVSGVGSTLNGDSSCVGYYGAGELNITDGAVVTHSRMGVITHLAGSSGTVTVSGVGSKWILGTGASGGALYVGRSGGGVLNIIDGGTVEAHGSAFIGDGTGSSWTNPSAGLSYGILNLSGNLIVDNETWVACKTDDLSVIHFDGGTLTTKVLLAGSSQMTGTGTINTNSMIVDSADLVFDTPESRQQTFILNNHGQDITINLNQQDSCVFGAGFDSRGSVTICNGHELTSTTGYIGYKEESIGSITVSGIGSTWSNTGNLYVGHAGTGLLNIIDGAVVNSSILKYGDGCIVGTKGTINVSGAGSELNHVIQPLRIGPLKRLGFLCKLDFTGEIL